MFGYRIAVVIGQPALGPERYPCGRWLSMPRVSSIAYGGLLLSNLAAMRAVEITIGPFLRLMGRHQAVGWQFFSTVRQQSHVGSHRMAARFAQRTTPNASASSRK
jgi:hypothetical protein